MIAFVSPVSVEHYSSDGRLGRVENIAPGEVYVVMNSDSQSRHYYLVDCEPNDDGAIVYRAQSIADFTNHKNTLEIINPDDVKMLFRVNADSAESLAVKYHSGVVLGKLIIKHHSV